MDPMTIFWLLWMLILPIVGIVTPIIFLVFWFFIVPAVARMLTWNRFRNVSIHAVGDDAGYVELVASKEYLPEGIVRTERGWHFLPRPIYKKEDETQNPGTDFKEIEQLGLRKYTLKGVGKPFFFDYAGKITSISPGMLAAFHQTKKQVKIANYFAEIQHFMNDFDLPKHFKKELTAKLKKLQQATKAKAVTLIDVNKIKQVVTKLYSPSTIDALAENRLLKGRRQAGKQYTPLIIGGAILVILLILGILAITMLMR